MELEGSPINDGAAPGVVGPDVQPELDVEEGSISQGLEIMSAGAALLVESAAYGSFDDGEFASGPGFGTESD